MLMELDRICEGKWANEPDEAINRPTVAVIGGGYSGSMLAVELLRLATGRISVVLIERGPVPGRGVAYGTQFEGHLLNVRAKNMSAYATFRTISCNGLNVTTAPPSGLTISCPARFTVSTFRPSCVKQLACPPWNFDVFGTKPSLWRIFVAEHWSAWPAAGQYLRIKSCSPLETSLLLTFTFPAKQPPVLASFQIRGRQTYWPTWPTVTAYCSSDPDSPVLT